MEPSIVQVGLKLHKDGSHFYPGQPFRWDNEKVSVENNNYWKFSLGFMFIFALVAIYSVGHFRERHDTIKMAYSWTLMMYTIAGGSVYCSMMLNLKETVEFLNGRLVVEQYFRGKGINLVGSKLGTILVNGFHITSRLVPLTYAIGAFIMPCFPVNFFAATLSHCQAHHFQSKEQSFTGWFAEVGTSSIISWIVYAGTFNVGFTVTTHIVIGFLFQISALKGFQRLIDSNLKKQHDTLLAYRQMQLLNKLFNLSHKNILIYALLALTMAETCWSYVLIRAPSSAIPTSVKVGASAMLAEMVWIQLGVYGYAGAIHSISSECLRKAGATSEKFNDPKLWKRGLRSCPPLKIVFGSSNYFEKSTPLKCFEFSVERFVDLLITMERQWRYDKLKGK